MSIQDLINTLLSTTDIVIIEKSVSIPNFLYELCLHINNLILNCQVEYDKEINENQEFDIKNIFIHDIKKIIKNLNIILIKYFQKNVGKLISIDLENTWYSNEKTIFIKDISMNNPFIKNRTISKILTIVCKSINFLNNYHIGKIIVIENEISHLEYRLEEQKKIYSVEDCAHILTHVMPLIESRKIFKEKYCCNFTPLHI